MDKKQRISDWAGANKIPGKIQAIFSAEPESGGGDWRYISRDPSRKIYNWEGLLPQEELPQIMQTFELQLEKEHLHAFKKNLMQAIFRSTGDGRYGLLLQTALRTPAQTHAYKTLLSFLQRSVPEILCCHCVQTKPFAPFDLSVPPESMQFTLHKGFGSEFLPLANTGYYFHILDWLPRSKGTYLQLPEKLKEWLHPAKGDCLLQCYSGAAFESLYLSKYFDEVHCLDVREWARLSFSQNSGKLPNKNAKFYKEKLEPKWVQKFFAGHKGKWTILINPPKGELLTQLLTKTIAAATPERIVHTIGYLENATKEINRWRSCGYVLRKTMPIEWHPNQKHLELAMLFVPDRAGLLGRKPNAGNKTKAPNKKTIKFVQK